LHARRYISCRDVGRDAMPMPSSLPIQGGKRPPQEPFFLQDTSFVILQGNAC
jgi:hypothetical protein